MKYILTAILLFNVAFGQSLFGVVAGDGFDIDARRYLDSAGITNTSHRAAFNTFVKGWKSSGLWTKTAAIHPFMGGSASSHKWNAKDVRDVDAAFRLTFPNGATHDANGVTFNGTTQYANTFFNPSTQLSNANSFAFGIYSRTNGASAFCDMGAANGSQTSSVAIYSRWSDGNFYGDLYDYSNSSNRIITVNNDLGGSSSMFILSRTSSTSLKAYKRGGQIGSTNTNTNSLAATNANIFIGAINSPGSGIFNYSSRNYCFSVIFTSGVSDSEASTAASLINTLQTALGRNTY